MSYTLAERIKQFFYISILSFWPYQGTFGGCMASKFPFHSWIFLFLILFCQKKILFSKNIAYLLPINELPRKENPSLFLLALLFRNCVLKTLTSQEFKEALSFATASSRYGGKRNTVYTTLPHKAYWNIINIRHIIHRERAVTKGTETSPKPLPCLFCPVMLSPNHAESPTMHQF